MLWDCSERLSWAIYDEALSAALNKTAKTSDRTVRDPFSLLSWLYEVARVEESRDGSTRSRCASITGWCRFIPSRMATAATPGSWDLLVMRLGGEWFSWGSANLDDAGAVRQHYIAALQAADNHDVGPLLAFARS